jgi:hypothetical protein
MLAVIEEITPAAVSNGFAASPLMPWRFAIQRKSVYTAHTSS